MEKSNLRKFRLIFEELVPEGRCKGSVLKRYRNYPITIASEFPEFSEDEIKNIYYHMLNTALDDFKAECLDSWDKIEYPEKLYCESTEREMEDQDEKFR